MIRINKLYSEPEVFDPIVFNTGLNIIMGDKSESTDKKIGVGKTMSIEFLSYCLLKKYKDTRLSLIPKSAFGSEVKIKLDLLINSSAITIERTLEKTEEVVIYNSSKPIIFDKLDSANEYLTNLYYKEFNVNEPRISLRNILAPILREERSEFKDIIQCYDTKKNIPSDYKPHLFYLNFGLVLYEQIQKTIKELDLKTKYFNETKKILATEHNLNISDAKAQLNQLKDEVSKLEKAIDKLKSNDSFDLIQDELLTLETKIDNLRTQQKKLKHELKQISFLPETQSITEDDISQLYNQFKEGLGDQIKKSLVQVRDFKNRIDNFKNTLINSRINNVKDQLLAVENELETLDEQHAEKLGILDTKGLLKDLKISIKVLNDKNKELNSLLLLIDRYDLSERQKKQLKTKKDNFVSELDMQKFENSIFLSEFNETILNIHEHVMGNRNANFELLVTSKKEIFDINFRIEDDGSHTAERMKVFIYDLALMTNANTSIRHPKFLVHDNLFEDDDSLEKSLNYINKITNKKEDSFQYIITINRDLTIPIEEKLKFDIEDYTIASFTKDNRFLKVKYAETKRK